MKRFIIKRPLFLNFKPLSACTSYTLAVMALRTETLVVHFLWFSCTHRK